MIMSCLSMLSPTEKKCINSLHHTLESKAKDSALDTSKLKSQIDSLVYEMYNLSQTEIKIENQ